MKNIIFIAVCIACISFAFGIIFDGHEATECYKWQTQAFEYSGFYQTEWQADQCAHHGIAIDAPVRVLYEDGYYKDFEDIDALHAYYK